MGGGALERGDGAALERLAQLVDALGSVGAAAVIIEAAELVVGQAAKREGGVSMGACDARKQILWGVAAHSSLVICVSSRMAASAEAPSAPMKLP